ncbi:MAG: DUF1064 domain-containing protein [Dysgonomonas sp.]
MRKYRNIKVGKYDSKKEKNRADLLKILEKQGEISHLKEQVKFELIPSQYEVIKNKKRCVEKSCSYIADFTYCDIHGNFIVEDTKGVRTEVYKIKKKLMLQVHGIRIKEV